MSISKEEIQTLRQALKTRQQVLEEDFFSHKNPATLLKKQAELIDELLKTIWLKFNINEACSLIATGGYGRGELFPFSDIDLLILVPSHISNETQNQEIETLIGVLWDIGLNVGHSVRNLQECIKEAAQDVTVQTNLLEARLLSGNNLSLRSFWMPSIKT